MSADKAIPELDSQAFWEAATGAPHDSIAIPIWRQFCDHLHRDLLGNWTEGRRYRRGLKTDLFDEAMGEGLAPHLQEICDEVDGIDISARVIASVARRHPGLTTHHEDVRRLTVKDGTYDLIVSNSTLDHFMDRNDLGVAIQELVRVLAPGGDLLITLDNPHNPVVAIRNLLPAWAFGRSSLAPYFVGHTLALRPLEQTLSGHGLQVLKSRHLLHAPRVLLLHFCRLFSEQSRTGAVVLHAMQGCERLGRLPTAAVTGHFVAVMARKPT